MLKPKMCFISKCVNSNNDADDNKILLNVKEVPIANNDRLYQTMQVQNMWENMPTIVINNCAYKLKIIRKFEKYVELMQCTLRNNKIVSKRRVIIIFDLSK